MKITLTARPHTFDVDCSTAIEDASRVLTQAASDEVLGQRDAIVSQVLAYADKHAKRVAKVEMQSAVRAEVTKRLAAYMVDEVSQETLEAEVLRQIAEFKLTASDTFQARVKAEVLSRSDELLRIFVRQVVLNETVRELGETKFTERVREELRTLLP